jgi:hypothetical protein
MLRTLIAVALGLGLALLAWNGASAKAAPYRPHVDPAEFQTTIDNPYYPLVPGTTWALVEKSGDRITEQNEITVTKDTKVVMGVTCVVVRDVVRDPKGNVTEDTSEWFAQDRQGNVWYFGEDTRELGPHGHVSTEGSWEAGVKGGQPGIIMWGTPKVGPAYRQEYGPGVAEDMAQIVALGDSISVPYGSFGGCVRTKEWSLLEPGTERKWYAKGVGIVRAESVEHAITSLVSVTRP